MSQAPPTPTTSHTKGEKKKPRDRLLSLGREIGALSESKIPPEEFYARFSNRFAQVVEPEGVAIFLQSRGPLRLAHEVGRNGKRRFFSDPGNARRNEPLLADALKTGETKAFRPGESGVPTEHLYIVAPISHHRDLVGALEVLMIPETTPTSRSNLIQFSEQMAGLISRYLSQFDIEEIVPPQPAKTVRGTRGPQVTVDGFAGQPVVATGAGIDAGGLPVAFWKELERFLLQLGHGRTVKEVAATAASDGRLLYEVDRVSLVRRKGRKIRVEAVSGQDWVNPKSNLVRRLRDLCQVAIAGREPVVYHGKSTTMPPPLELPLANYISESGSRLLILIPLLETGELIRPEFEDKEQEHDQVHAESKVIGCLVIESVNDSRLPPLLPEKIDLSADHIAVALQHAVTLDRIFLRRTLLTIGRLGEWFHGRKLAKTLAALSLVVAVGLALWLVPWPYKVVCEGELLPVQRRNVFAPFNGQVRQLAVEGGASVKRGELLLTLVNDELESKVIRVRNDLAEQRQAVETLARRAAGAPAGSQEGLQLDAQRRAAEAKVIGLEKQLKILVTRQEKLRVEAPIAGQVATFQLRELLGDRPVRRGEVLLEIMAVDENWHLVLNVQNGRMGEINEAIAARDGDINLPVEFVLATTPESKFTGTIVDIATRTHTTQEEGSVVRLEVALDHPEQLPKHRIGAEVRAKINTGDEPLGYVLFGDVIAFARRHLWI